MTPVANACGMRRPRFLWAIETSPEFLIFFDFYSAVRAALSDQVRGCIWPPTPLALEKPRQSKRYSFLLQALTDAWPAED